MYVNSTFCASLFKIGSGVLLSLLLIGCSEKQLEVKTVAEDRMKLNLQEPDQLKLKPISFYVVTEKNTASTFKQLELEKKDKVLISMSDEDYQKMSENLVLIQNYIVKQRFIIKSYKDYYEKSPESSQASQSTENKD